MLEYTHGGRGPRFELLVLHDDAAREYAYVAQPDFETASGLPTGGSRTALLTCADRCCPKCIRAEPIQRIMA
jgi:hypothetical protein